jgi:hypothetical protein
VLVILDKGTIFQSVKWSDQHVCNTTTWVLDRKCEFIAIHEESKDDIMHPDWFRKTDGLPREPLDAGPQGEMLALDLLGVLLTDCMGLQTQMPLIHAGVIGVKSWDAKGL